MDWSQIISKIIGEGGIVGVAAIILALVSYYVVRAFLAKTDKLEGTLREQGNKCVECVKRHDEQIIALQIAHQAQLEKMQGCCAGMLEKFYDTTRADTAKAREENLSLFGRVVDSNNDVTDCENHMNNTLSSISGKLNGR